MTRLLEYLGLDFSQLIILVIVLVISIIAVKLTITFDINKYLENKKEAKLNRLKNACTHHQLLKSGKKYSLQSSFISPPGTLKWQCQRCGAAKYFADGELKKMTEYYLKNIEEYTKQEKKFKKLLKKNGLR